MVIGFKTMNLLDDERRKLVTISATIVLVRKRTDDGVTILACRW